MERTQAFGLSRQAPALIVVEPESASAKLLAENTILLSEVVNRLQLPVVHPSGERDQHKPEWTQDSLHSFVIIAAASRADRNRVGFWWIGFRTLPPVGSAGSG